MKKKNWKQQRKRKRMAEKTKIYGYEQEFKSKSDAIRFLILEGKSVKEIKEKIPYITDQHIYQAQKKIKF